MTDHYRVVIVGGGVAGCSIAYHLARMGWRDVVVLDKGELTSGSTFHSAGLVGQLRASVALTRINMASVALYDRLREETGRDPGWRQVGSLRLASSKERLLELRRQAGWARTFGFPLTVISAREAVDLFPLMSPKDLEGAAYLPTDGHIDPGGLTYALAEGARAKGVTFRTGVRVQAITVKGGRVSELLTDQGTLKTEVVVNAAGIWAPDVGLMVGVRLPAIAMSHQYLTTKPIEGVRRDVPTMRDPDRLVYFREEVGGLVVGGFERHPAPWGLDGIPPDFTHRLLPPDWERFSPLLENAVTRVPALANAQVIRLINGPEAYTPDGEFILGEAPGVKGFFVAAGFCAHGIAGAGGVGQVMAEWIVEGRPSLDLRQMNVGRFRAHHADRDDALGRVMKIYSTYYDIRHASGERRPGRARFRAAARLPDSAQPRRRRSGRQAEA